MSDELHGDGVIHPCDRPKSGCQLLLVSGAEARRKGPADRAHCPATTRLGLLLIVLVSSDSDGLTEEHK